MHTMKSTVTYSLMAVICAALIFTSCRPSRVYAYKDKNRKDDRRERSYDRDDRSYRNTPYVSLILRPTPGFVMNKYPDGRFYHRSPEGFMYWKGFDNRFYLDRSYIRKVRYDQYEYNEWRRGLSDVSRGYAY
jgi:hypothetical protein